MLCLGRVIFHLDFINVSKYIHPITLEAATEIASNLRPDDLREVEEGHGVEASTLPSMIAQNPSYVYFTVPNGKTAGMAGVGPQGEVWMLCTPVILRLFVLSEGPFIN